MPLDCLNGLVTVKGCGSNPTSSYIQQLPGISIPDIDVSINTDHANAKAFLEEQILFAQEIVIQDVYQHLSLKHELKSFIDNDTVGEYYEQKTTVDAQAAYLTGIRLRIDSTPYLKLFINQIRLFVNTTGDVDILIYDLQQGKLLDTITVEAVAGEIVTTNVNKEYFTQRQRMNLFICYASTFESYKANVTNGVSGDDCTDCNSYSNGHVSFFGSKILSASQKTTDNIEGNSGTAGISFGYSLSCSFEEHLCNIRNLLALPLKYKAGELIMQQLKVSKRPNPLVTAYKGDNDELMGYYNGEYNKHMKALLKNMKLPSSACFECKPQSKSVLVLP